MSRHLTTLHRSLQTPNLLSLSLSLRFLSSDSQPPLITKTRTPLETQFETWISHLKPGFTPLDVSLALKSQPDPDLALDIFRWTSHQKNYQHNSLTYLTAIEISIKNRRYNQTETLIEEVISGACLPSLALFNTIIRFCTNRRPLFNRSFDVYKKMLRSENAKPDLETYSMLFNAILRRFNKLHVCYVYLHPVRSLTKQMKANGVVPDLFVLNMIIKAFSKCLEMDEAIRVFREMGLYGCEPNNYTYSYLLKGFCEKGRVSQAMGIYNEAKGKNLVVKSSAFCVLICSLAIEGRFEEGFGVVFDMLSCGMFPDMLSYKTILEGLCRSGRGDEALEILEQIRKKDTMMNERVYKSLLNGLHFFNRD